MTGPDFVPPHIAELAVRAGLGRLVRAFTARRKLQLFSEDVYVFEHGGVFVPGRDQHVVIPWAGVAQFYQAVTREKHLVDKVIYRYRFVSRDGTDHTIRAATTMGAKAGLEDFGPMVDELVSRAIVPGLLRSIRDGGTISFNTYRLDADGISSGPKGSRLAWADVGDIQYTHLSSGWSQLRTSEPYIVVKAKAGQGRMAKAAVTGNHAALFEIVRRFVKREVSRPTRPGGRGRRWPRRTAGSTPPRTPTSRTASSVRCSATRSAKPSTGGWWARSTAGRSRSSTS